MAGTPVSLGGARDFTDVNALEHVRSVEKAIELLESDKTAFLKELNGLPKTNIRNVTHEWYLDEVVPSKYVLNAAIGAAAPLAADNIDLTGRGEAAADIHVQVGERLRVALTGEIMQVAAIGAGGMADVDVLRDVAGTGGLAVDPAVEDGMLINLGNTSEENSIMYNSFVPGDLRSLTTQKRRMENFSETLRTAIGMSRRQMNAEEYGGDDLPLQRMKDTLSHLEKINHKLWWGVRTPALANGDTATGGIDWAIQTQVEVPGSNTFDLGGAPLDEETFNDFLRTFSRYGNTSKKLFVASRYVCDQISGFTRVAQPVAGADSGIRRSVDNGMDKSLGTHIGQYISGTGFSCKIVSDNALEGIPGEAPAAFGGPANGIPRTFDGVGYLLDMEKVGLFVHGGTWMQHEKDERLPTQDGITETLTSDFGLKYGYPEKHGRIVGIA